MIKKAVIPAAGKGTRMLHLARNKPKSLIHVNNRPFLYYLLNHLKEAGIEEILLVVGHKKEAMEEFAKKYDNEFDIKLIDQFATFGTDYYGTAMPIRAAKKFTGDDQFIAIHGDNLYSPRDIQALTEAQDDFQYLSVIEHSHPEKYGVILRDGDMLTDWQEKPATYVSNLINTGLYKFTPEIFYETEQVVPSPRGEYELTDAIKALGKMNKVKVRTIKDYWLDFGNPADVMRVSKFLNGNRPINY